MVGSAGASVPSRELMHQLEMRLAELDSDWHVCGVTGDLVQSLRGDRAPMA